MTLEEFWVAFAPNLAATFLGALLGIPAGWALERRLQAEAKRTEASTRAARTREALDLVRRAVEENQFNLVPLAKTQAGLINLAPPLNASAWDALHGELVHVGNPAIKYEVALYFGQIKTLLAMNQQVMDYRFGVGIQVQDAARDSALNALRSMVPSRAQSAMGRGASILALIERELV